GQNGVGDWVVRVAYTYYTGVQPTGHYHIRYAECTTASCIRLTSRDTENVAGPHDEVRPAIAWGDGHWKAAFRTSYGTQSASLNRLAVGYENLDTGTANITVVPNTQNTATGCTVSGDYDSMAY